MGGDGVERGDRGGRHRGLAGCEARPPWQRRRALNSEAERLGAVRMGTGSGGVGMHSSPGSWMQSAGPIQSSAPLRATLPVFCTLSTLHSLHSLRCPRCTPPPPPIAPSQTMARSGCAVLWLVR